VYSFITRQIAKRAIELVLPTIQATMEGGEADGNHLHIVVALQDDYEMPVHPDISESGEIGTLHMTIVTEYSLGDPATWEHAYNDIAINMAELSARTGLDTRVVHTVRRDLLQPGDVRYWGSAIKNGVIVACSGAQSQFDEFFSKAILAALEVLVENMLITRQLGNSIYLVVIGSDGTVV
jgi:hypothetical protein